MSVCVNLTTFLFKWNGERLMKIFPEWLWRWCSQSPHKTNHQTSTWLTVQHDPLIFILLYSKFLKTGCQDSACFLHSMKIIGSQLWTVFFFRIVICKITKESGYRKKKDRMRWKIVTEQHKGVSKANIHPLQCCTDWIILLCHSVYLYFLQQAI